MKRRRSLLQSNAFARLISLLMGFSLWVVVNSSIGGDSTQNGLAMTTAVLQNIPVTVVTSSHMIAVSVRPRKVAVSVSGSVIEVATVQVESSAIRAVAKAVRLGAGVHQIPLVIENVPDSTATYTPNLPTITVDLQPKITATFPVQVLLQGQPQTGLSIGKSTTQNIRAAVSGPDTLVHQVSRVIANVNVAGAQTDISRNLPLVAMDAAGREITGLTISPSTLEVHVPIHGQVRTVPISVATIGKPASGFAVASVAVQPTSVQLYGSSTLLQGVQSIVLPPINVTGWKVGKIVSLTIPLPFTGSRVSQPTVTVTVALGPSSSVVLSNVLVGIVSPQPGVHYQLLHSSTISVTVSGPPQTINELTNADIQAFVDVSSLQVGKRGRLPVQIALPPGCHIVHLSANGVIVTATAKP